MKRLLFALTVVVLSCLTPLLLLAKGQVSQVTDLIYNPGHLKPIDSTLKVKVGDMAPDFSLPAIGGKEVSLADYRDRNNVVLSFIPAAWTPVCSDQWPGYNLAQKVFLQHNAVLLGLAVDNIPTLHAWISQIGGMWFDILSDFWPHGKVADRYGVLRGDGMADRVLIFINTEGIITSIIRSDINVRPPLEDVFTALKTLQ